MAWDKKITPEEEVLLRGRNFREYPTIQESSAANVAENSDMTKNSGDVADDDGTDCRKKRRIK